MTAWPEDAPHNQRVAVVDAYEQRRAELLAL
jgi:hypothetical protein